jgi:hypothetical protein
VLAVAVVAVVAVGRGGADGSGAPSSPAVPAADAASPQPIPDGSLTTTVPVDLDRAYEAVTGGPDAVAATGAPRCERGVRDERAWSRPATPDVVAGRYSCGFAADGRAEMWWTDERAGRLAHAVRDDSDLAALFAWWRSSTA